MVLTTTTKVAKIIKIVLNTIGRWVRSGNLLLVAMGLILFALVIYAGFTFV